MLCLEEMVRVREHGRIGLDNQNLILEEYANNLNFSGSPGAGDEFFKYVHNNQHVASVVVRASITSNEVRGFDEFPDSPDLEGFDPSDRKFVATQLVLGSTFEILNAVDSDWDNASVELKAAGVVFRTLST